MKLLSPEFSIMDNLRISNLPAETNKRDQVCVINIYDSLGTSLLYELPFYKPWYHAEARGYAGLEKNLIKRIIRYQDFEIHYLNKNYQLPKSYQECAKYYKTVNGYGGKCTFQVLLPLLDKSPYIKALVNSSKVSLKQFGRGKIITYYSPDFYLCIDGKCKSDDDVCWVSGSKSMCSKGCAEDDDCPGTMYCGNNPLKPKPGGYCVPH
ncbi:hypothetical protein ACFLZP_00985 [Patescibacteria group bacterium]